MQMEKWSIICDVIKHVQHNQYPIDHYEVEVKAAEDGCGTKMYKNYRIGEREIKI